MKIEVQDDRSIALKEVFSGVLFISPSGEELGICMRDSGFEFQYSDTWYEAKNGQLRLLSPQATAPSKARQPVESKGEACHWSQIEDGDDDNWSTSCGQEWSMDIGAPDESGYKYCPNCGKPIDFPRPVETKGEKP